MTEVVVVLVGAVLGFLGARVLRRPGSTAGAAAVARSAASAMGARRGLDLAQLQRAAFSEMIRHVAVFRGRAVVPERFRVRLHPQDHQTVQQAPGWFTQGLDQALRSAGRQHGWQVPPRVAIEVAADPARRAGDPGVDAMGSGGQPQPVPAAPAPAAVAPRPPVLPGPSGPPRLERTDGRTVPLGADEVTIGRGADRTVRIDDDRVSRRHATIRPERDGWTVTDEGSSNGTRVGGRRLAPGVPQPLRDGDRIEVGPVTLVFRAGADAPGVATRPPAGATEAPTAALDPRQRDAISREIFGDGPR